MQRPLKSTLLPLFLSIFFALLFLWPTLPHLTTQFIGDGGDNYEYASYMGYTAREISLGNFPLNPTNYWRYPDGIDFNRSFDSYLTLSIGTFWTLLIGLPISYNLTVITLLSLNGLFSYLFFRYISKSTILGILGMIIYGFAFYPLAKSSSHLNLLFVGGFPLFAYALIRLLAYPHPKQKDFVFVALSALFVALGSLQYFVLLFIACLLTLLVFGISYPSKLHQYLTLLLQNAKAVCIASSIFGVGFLLFFHPQLVSLISGTFQFSGRSDVLFETTPGIWNFFLPNGYREILLGKLVTNPHSISIESAVFIGWVELILFALFLTTKAIDRRFRLMMGLLFLIPFFFALGYGKENSFFLLPYTVLQHLPLFSTISEPGRYFVLFYLILTTGIVLYLRYAPSQKYLTRALILILLLVSLERFPTAVKMVATLKNEPYIKTVQQYDTKAVVDLPINLYYPNYNLLSLFYERPIVNGYFHWSADGDKEKAFLTQSGLLERYSCNTNDPILETLDEIAEIQADAHMIGTLKEAAITTLVLHKDNKFYHDVCRNVRLRLTLLTPFVTIPQETRIQTEITTLQTEGKPSITVYFPKNGIFHLDGLYIAPQKDAPFMITTSTGQEIGYTWVPIGPPHAFELSPKDTIEVPVTAGSTLTISSTSMLTNTFFSLWYRYVPEENTTAVPYEPTLLNVFEDKNTIVYTL